MPCFAGKLERERAELRELLEMANAQREDFRRAGEHTRMRLEQTQAQLDVKSREANQTAAALRREEDAREQTQARAGRLEEQLQQTEQSLASAEASQQELRTQLQRVAAERDASHEEARKLAKEREYLRQRVDRMQQALSMLESVLDDTLQEGMHGAAERASARERSNALRQSKENMAEMLAGIRSRERQDSARAGTDTSRVSLSAEAASKLRQSVAQLLAA